MLSLINFLHWKTRIISSFPYVGTYPNQILHGQYYWPQLFTALFTSTSRPTFSWLIFQDFFFSTLRVHKRIVGFRQGSVQYKEFVKYWLKIEYKISTNSSYLFTYFNSFDNYLLFSVTMKNLASRIL